MVRDLRVGSGARRSLEQAAAKPLGPKTARFSNLKDTESLDFYVAKTSRALYEAKDSPATFGYCAPSELPSSGTYQVLDVVPSTSR